MNLEFFLNYRLWPSPTLRYTLYFSHWFLTMMILVHKISCLEKLRQRKNSDDRKGAGVKKASFTSLTFSLAPFLKYSKQTWSTIFYDFDSTWLTSWFETNLLLRIFPMTISKPLDFLITSSSLDSQLPSSPSHAVHLRFHKLRSSFGESLLETCWLDLDESWKSKL